MKPVTVVAAGCLFAASLARAGDGYVTGDVDLRAGPDPGYPTVATLNAGTPVSIQGCVANWSWCDVATASDRGWVAGDFLEEDYEGQRVVVPAFGVQVGIPIVTFSFDAYWGAHYHNEHYQNRPWYSDRARWAKVHPRYAPPMRHPIDANAGKKAAENPTPRTVARSNHPQPAHAPAPAARESAQAVHPEASAPPKPVAQTAKPTPKPPPPHENAKNEHGGEHGSDAGKDKDEVRKDEKGSNAPGKDADPNKHQR